jgi:hypothetical protein
VKSVTHKKLYSFLLLSAALVLTTHAKTPPPPTPVDVETVKEKIAAYAFDPSVELVLGPTDMVSEEELYRLSLEISVGDTVFKLSSRNDSKRAIPDESSCVKSGNTIYCTSDEITADTRGTPEDPSGERTVCSQPVLEISGSDQAKRILVQAKSLYWTTNAHSTCQDAKDRGAHTVTRRIAKFRSLTK